MSRLTFLIRCVKKMLVSYAHNNVAGGVNPCMTYPSSERFRLALLQNC